MIGATTKSPLFTPAVLGTCNFVVLRSGRRIAYSGFRFRCYQRASIRVADSDCMTVTVLQLANGASIALSLRNYPNFVSCYQSISFLECQKEA